MKTLERSEVVAFLEANPGIANREAARRLNCHESFIRRCKTTPGADMSAPEPEPDSNVTTRTTGDRTVIEFATDKLIQSEADALAHAKVDLSVWQVASMTLSTWQVPIKLRVVDAGGQRLSDAPHVKQMTGVKLELRRILPKPYHDATTLLFDRLRSYAPAYASHTFAKPATPHLLEIDLFDVHFGKLAWRAETGQDYDLRLASLVYRNAVEDLLGYASGFEVDRILLPIGNDFYHVDTLNSTTTSGTHVDSDGRYAKIIEAGEMAVVWAIERLTQVAPVSVLWVPGNHDRVASYHLVRTLAAWFRQCPHVDVDHSPKVRKYFEYGKNLLGYTHGHQEPHRALPMLMATEESAAWARTTRRAWRIGHLHHSRKTETRAVGDHDSVSVQIMQSLSGKDAYHFERGYGGRRAAEAFILSADGLTAANFQVSAREG
ncbi:MAG: hypothetical protein ACXWNW_13705 [Isosphaeraceae bacterium]